MQDGVHEEAEMQRGVHGEGAGGPLSLLGVRTASNKAKQTLNTLFPFSVYV